MMDQFTERDMTVLSNGVTIATSRLSSPRAAFQIVVNAGSSQELDGEHGAGHFVEHLLMTRQEMQRVEQQFGFGEPNLVTDFYNVRMPLRGRGIFYVLKDQFPQAFDMFLNAVSNPQINAANIENERARILEEAASASNDENKRLYFAWQSCLYPKSYRGKLVVGEVHDIQSLTPQILTDFWQRNYVGRRIKVFATGDVTHDSVVEQVEAKLGHLQAGHPAEISPLSMAVAEAHFPESKYERLFRYARNAILRRSKQGADQINATLVWPGIVETDKRGPQIKITSKILNSQISRELLTGNSPVYEAYAGNSCSPDCGELSVTCKFDQRKTHHVILGIGNVVRSLAKAVPEEIFSTTKLEIANSLRASEYGAQSEIGNLQWMLSSFGKLRPDSDILDGFMVVTREDVRSIAEEFLLKTTLSLRTDGLRRFPYSRHEVDAAVRRGIPLRDRNMFALTSKFTL